MNVIMGECKNMKSDADYKFFARVPINGSDKQASAVQRGALTLIKQGMDASKSPEKCLAWVERASEVSDVPSIGFEVLRFDF